MDIDIVNRHHNMSNLGCSDAQTSCFYADCVSWFAEYIYFHTIIPSMFDLNTDPCTISIVKIKMSTNFHLLPKYISTPLALIEKVSMLKEQMFITVIRYYIIIIIGSTDFRFT